MMMQADSELAGAFGYVPWIMKSPDIRETLQVSQIVKDVVRHARVMYRLLETLGVDVDDYFQEPQLQPPRRPIGHRHRARLRRPARQHLLLPHRGYLVRLHHVQLLAWTAARAISWRTRSSAQYKPWCDGMDGIFKEEAMHMAHGDQWTERLLQGRQDPR